MKGRCALLRDLRTRYRSAVTDAVQFHVSRARILVIGLALGPLMTAASALLVIAAVVGWLPLGLPLLWLFCVVVGAAGAVFFGYATVAWLSFLRRSGACLVIDSEGFTDTSSAVAAGRTTWDQVTGWHLHQIQGQTSLCVMVKDPESVLARLRPVARLFAQGNAKLVGTPVCIALNGLRGGAELVITAFERHYDQWSRHNGGNREH